MQASVAKEFAYQIWTQSSKRFVCKWAEKVPPIRGQEPADKAPTEFELD